MSRQFPDKKSVGIPPDFILYLKETQAVRDQTKKLLEDERANENVRVANENARKAAEAGRANAEAIRVLQERQRVSAEASRQHRFERLADRINALEDARARVARVERGLAVLRDQYELLASAIDTLGMLHDDVPYLYLNGGMYCGADELSIEDGIPVFSGATVQGNVLSIAGVINEKRAVERLPDGVDYMLAGEGLYFAEDKMHMDGSDPVFDNATASEDALNLPGTIRIKE